MLPQSMPRFDGDPFFHLSFKAPIFLVSLSFLCRGEFGHAVLGSVGDLALPAYQKYRTLDHTSTLYGVGVFRPVYGWLLASRV